MYFLYGSHYLLSRKEQEIIAILFDIDGRSVWGFSFPIDEILFILNQNFPMIQILKDKEQDKKEKKKCAEKKRPAQPYILWCKDQWNEVD